MKLATRVLLPPSRGENFLGRFGHAVAHSLIVTSLIFGTPLTSEALPPGVVSTELAGRSLSDFPHFEYLATFNEGAPISVALDPRFVPQGGRSCAVIVTTAKSDAVWTSNPSLQEVRGVSESRFFGTGSIQSNRHPLQNSLLLTSDFASTGFAGAYDIVLDCDHNGTLSAGDIIDGGTDTAGLYVAPDTVKPGPSTVTSTIYNIQGLSSPQNAYAKLYYPSDISSLGQLPLIIITHGNGLNYQQYDYIANHLASHRFIVMSHMVDLSAPPVSTSQSLLEHTLGLIALRNVLAGGALAGHMDIQHVVWAGHSRGGQAAVRAYQRLFEGEYVPQYYSPSDIALITAIAPAASNEGSRSYDVPFHLWMGTADTDTAGRAHESSSYGFPYYTRSEGDRQATVIHGAGHGDFADDGPAFAAGPCLLGRSRVQRVVKGYMLPLVRYFTLGDPAAKDFLWRQWESFRPIGAPTSPCTHVSLLYQPAPDSGDVVLDNYQTNSSVYVSSSGTLVATNASNAEEGHLSERDYTYMWFNCFCNDGSPLDGCYPAGPVGTFCNAPPELECVCPATSTIDPFNGCILNSGNSGEGERGVSLEWSNIGTTSYLEIMLTASARDLTTKKFLTFRAAQVTQHPFTTTSGDLTFAVTLVDTSARTRTIKLSTLGSGLESPYQRIDNQPGYSRDEQYYGIAPPGWYNVFETIRIRLSDFQNNGLNFDLTNVLSVRLEFGTPFGSAQGRIVVDDVELVAE